MLRPAERMKRVAADLLYLHPAGHLNDLVIPTGALTCLNAVDASKLGRYGFEVTDAEIAAARVVAIDLHWALGLPGLTRLVAQVRTVNPAVPIVVGGITAGFYPGELLDLGVDYVVRGHAEHGFATLVDRLLAATDPAVIPGVWQRDQPPPPPAPRPSPAELDALDSLTAAWFPTYEECSNWDAAAFPAGRTITVARGCVKRCPTCYGSYAATFGGGRVVRSPSAVVADTARAAAMGLRNLRYFAGKPSASEWTALTGALAAAGPFELSSAVGFYLCRAPTTDDLDRLEAAFSGPVAISMIPPDQHQPPGEGARTGDELAAWQRAARHIERSHRLQLDAWAGVADLATTRRHFVPSSDRRVKVSSAAAWSITRPTDAGRPDLAELAATMASLWTFYAARALSPALAELLAGFDWLDEIDRDPLTAPPPGDRRRSWHDLILASWRDHALPLLPGLRFALWPLAGPVRPAVHPRGVARSPLFVAAPPIALDPAAPPNRLDHGADHRGDFLTGPLPAGARFALVPCLPGGELDADWIATLAAHPMVVVDTTVPDGERSTTTVRLRVHLQGIDATIWCGSDLVARGGIDLGYFGDHTSPPGPTDRPRVVSSR